MRKSKKIFIILAIFIIAAAAIEVIFLMYYSHGEKVTSEPVQIIAQNQKANVGSVVQNLNPVVVKTVIIVNGKKNPFLCTFQNNEKALEKVKKNDAVFLQLMQKKWSLKELDNSNWQTYEKELVAYTAGKLPEDLGGDKYEKQRQEFEGFLGIYEDEDLNNETLKYIEKANRLLRMKLIRKISLDQIIGNLPFNNKLAMEA